jgi:hypothetical protein
MHHVRARAGVLFVVAAALGWGAGGAAAADPARTTFAQAVADVKSLGEQVRDRKRGNSDLIGTIDAIEREFFRVEPPTDAPPDWPARKREWQEKALDHLVAALRAVDADGRAQNARNDVNLRAAEVLGRVLGSKDLLLLRDEKAAAALRAARARALMAVLGTDFGRAGTKDHEVPAGVLEATFAALARTNDARAFDWLAKEYVHTRGGAFEEARLVAAQRALTLFTGVPGRKRHELVEHMTRIYSGTDASARQNTPEGRANKAFWDRVRVPVIALINHLATAPGGGPPTDEKGLGLTTMDELTAWWRAHKKPTQAPWLDPKPAK